MLPFPGYLHNISLHQCLWHAADRVCLIARSLTVYQQRHSVIICPSLVVSTVIIYWLHYLYSDSASWFTNGTQMAAGLCQSCWQTNWHWSTDQLICACASWWRFGEEWKGFCSRSCGNHQEHSMKGCNAAQCRMMQIYCSNQPWRQNTTQSIQNESVRSAATSHAHSRHPAFWSHDLLIRV